jgi:signal transduction histidine kinase
VRYGHTIDTFIGTNIFSYFPEDLRRLRLDKLAKSIQTRSPVRYEDYSAGRSFDNCLYPVISSDKKVIGVTVFARDITDRKHYEYALKEAKEELEIRVNERTASLSSANEQIRQITFQLLKAEEQERIRIASELHDQVGQSLLLVKMKVDTLASNTATNVNDVKSADISRLLEACIQDIRTLTFDMRPHLLDTAGIEAALEWLCKSIYENYRVKVDFSTSCRSLLISGEHRYSLYQAVRELLLNVVKHAGVNYTELTLKTNGNYLMIQISDKGSGFETTSQSCSSASSIGFGLYNVQQRIEFMGGSCRLDSKPGQGTVVTLTIPIGE